MGFRTRTRGYWAPEIELALNQSFSRSTRGQGLSIDICDIFHLTESLRRKFKKQHLRYCTYILSYL